MGWDSLNIINFKSILVDSFSFFSLLNPMHVTDVALTISHYIYKPQHTCFRTRSTWLWCWSSFFSLFSLHGAWDPWLPHGTWTRASALLLDYMRTTTHHPSAGSLCLSFRHALERLSCSSSMVRLTLGPAVAKPFRPLSTNAGLPCLLPLVSLPRRATSSKVTVMQPHPLRLPHHHHHHPHHHPWSLMTWLPWVAFSSILSRKRSYKQLCLLHLSDLLV